MYQLVRGLTVAIATLALFTTALPTFATDAPATPAPTPTVVERRSTAGS